MPAVITLTMRCLTSAGGLVLDVSEANGYEIVALTQGGRSHRRSVVTADDVEGHRLQQAVLDSATYEILLRVKGTTSAQVETRRQALKDAIEAFAWQLEIGIDGVTETWLADPGDSQTAQEWVDLHHTRRHMVLRIPVQPRTVQESA